MAASLVVDVASRTPQCLLGNGQVSLARSGQPQAKAARRGGEAADGCRAIGTQRNVVQYFVRELGQRWRKAVVHFSRSRPPRALAYVSAPGGLCGSSSLVPPPHKNPATPVLAKKPTPAWRRCKERTCEIANKEQSSTPRAASLHPRAHRPRPTELDDIRTHYVRQCGGRLLRPG